MYADFYGLRESPFALTPDPRYLFLSEPHKEALASAVYGVQERKGFVLILGEVGTGKTTLIRHLLGRFGPNIRSVFVFNPAVSFLELLQLILRDLELPCPSLRRVEMIETLNEYLLREAAAGRYVVVIIDEAQHLSPAVLEEVRMLSNLETATGKLIQILLVGQPELGEKLGRPELRQLRQRISLVAELKPLSYQDTVRYIAHRLEVAGYAGNGIFTRRALQLVYHGSGGIPRLVNVICDKALVLGYAADAKRIKRKVIREVLNDWRHFQQRSTPSAGRARARLSGHARVPARRPLARIAAVVLVGMIAAAMLLMVAGPRDTDLLARFWHGVRPARISGTILASLKRPALRGESSSPPAVQSEPAPEPSPEPAATAQAEAAAEPVLPPRPEPRLPEMRRTNGTPPPAAVAPPPIELATLPSRGPAREVVVGPGEVFSEVVNRHYGWAELTLLDFVKTANPDLTSIDVLQVGQRLRLPAFEPRALVQSTDGSKYRVHLVTVWNNQSDVISKLRASIAKRGRQLYVVPVKLTERDPAYRVLAGDFTDRQEAEAFYKSFRAATGLTTQLWK